MVSVQVKERLFRRPYRFTGRLIVQSHGSGCLSSEIFILGVLPNGAFNSSRLTKRKGTDNLVSFRRLRVRRTRRAKVNVDCLIFTRDRFAMLRCLLKLVRESRPNVIFGSNRVLFRDQAVAGQATNPVINLCFTFVRDTFRARGTFMLLIRLIRARLGDSVDRCRRNEYRTSYRSRGVSRARSFPFRRIAVNAVPVVPCRALSMLIPRISSDKQLVFSTAVFPSDEQVVQ